MTEPTPELPIEDAKPQARAAMLSPEAEKAAAEAEVERISKERLEVLRQGTDAPPGQRARIDARLAAAGRRLGAAGLQIDKKGARLPFNDEKFCRQDTLVSDLQQNLLNRSSEFSRAHADRNGLRNERDAFEQSDDGKVLRDNLNRLGRGEQLSEHAVRIGRNHARLRERLVAAEDHRARMAAALAEVKERCQIETAVLASWRAAILKLRGGARMLEQIPKPHQRVDLQTDPARAGYDVLEIGEHAMPREVRRPSQSAAAEAPAPSANAARPGLRTSAETWAHANKQTSARHGIGPASAAFDPVLASTARLIETINSDPQSLTQLAARAGELTENERTAALEAYRPSRDASPEPAPKARKAAPRAKGKTKPPVTAQAKPREPERSSSFPLGLGLLGLRRRSSQRI